MAYVSKELKAKIAAALKEVVPADWKYSLAVQHHSGIVFNLRSAPVDLCAEWVRRTNERRGADRDQHLDTTHIQVNPYYAKDQFDESLPVIEKILEALNIDNWDKSDIQTDYFDVGHYVYLNIGKWDKPFTVTGGAQ